MSEFIKLIHDLETGEIIEREMTDEEIQILLASQSEASE
jgi:hypothetical protein